VAAKDIERSKKMKKNLNIVNLTPHALNLMPEGPDGPVVTIPPSGLVARCAVDRVQVDTVTVDGISVPVNQTWFGEVSDLPEPQPDTIFVVSTLVAQAVPDYQDVFIVDDVVRDEQGRIIGCRALAHVTFCKGSQKNCSRPRIRLDKVL
jgi:hypothetical protein